MIKDHRRKPQVDGIVPHSPIHTNSSIVRISYPLSLSDASKGPLRSPKLGYSSGSGGVVHNGWALRVVCEIDY
jgi:hypothetical protein